MGNGARFADFQAKEEESNNFKNLADIKRKNRG